MGKGAAALFAAASVWGFLLSSPSQAVSCGTPSRQGMDSNDASRAIEPSSEEPDAHPAPVAPISASDPLAAPPSASKPYLLDRLAAGASLGYFTASRARILSEIHFDFPFLVVREKSLYVRGSLETSTVKTGRRFRADSFQAQDVDYLAEVGARDYLNNRIAIAAFFGQQGREQLDQAGAGSVRYVGLGFESAGFPRPGDDRFEWRLALAAALDANRVEADSVARGAVLYDLWRGRRSSVGIDGSFDTLLDGWSGQTEYRIGPRWTFPLGNGIRANLFAEWIRGKNPLLLADAQGWNFGFRYAEGAYSGPHERTLPDVRGVLSLAGGLHRGLGRFDVDLSSPELQIFKRPGRIFANLDANVLKGAGTDNLFYIATAGVEAAILPRVLIGPAIYHRSNHTLGEGPTQATNLNIVEVIARTPGWDYTDRSEGHLLPHPDPGATPGSWHWLDRLEGILAPGVVTNSNFTDAQSWDVQAGVRYDLTSRSRRIVPFIRGFGQWGDVDRTEIGLGFSTRQNLVLELRYRRDNQYFGNDPSDVFLQGSLYF